MENGFGSRVAVVVLDVVVDIIVGVIVVAVMAEVMQFGLTLCRQVVVTDGDVDISIAFGDVDITDKYVQKGIIVCVSSCVSLARCKTTKPQSIGPPHRPKSPNIRQQSTENRTARPRDLRLTIFRFRNRVRSHRCAICCSARARLVVAHVCVSCVSCMAACVSFVSARVWFVVWLIGFWSNRVPEARTETQTPCGLYVSHERSAATHKFVKCITYS